MKRISLLVLILSLLTQSLVFAGYDGGSIVKESEWEVYKTANYLDPTLPYKTTNGLPFNKELYEELGIVLYGDYNTVSRNDFKEVTGGYYSKNGTKGEYRYHGMDRTGTVVVNNTNFPDDVAGPDAERRDWYYQPWIPSSVAYSSFQKHSGSQSIYNQQAIDYDDKDAIDTQKWIGNGIDYIKKGIISYGNTAPNLNPYNYLNVESAPTPIRTGQGTMYSRGSVSGRTFYQTFPVARIEEKNMTPVEADIPLDKLGVTKVSENGDLTIQVKVTGELLDEAYYQDETLKTIYYIRDDIKRWNFTLRDSITNNTLTVQGVKSVKNKGYAIFEVNIPQAAYENYLKEDNIFTINFTGTATALFYTDESSTDTISVSKDFKGTNVEVIAPEASVDEIDPAHFPIEFTVSAPHKILDVDNFPVTLTVTNDEQAVDRYVTIDGKRLSEADETKFLNGQYKFPRIREDRPYRYRVVYVHEEGYLFYYQSYVVVYDSIPSAQVMVGGTHKVNRKITVSADKSITTDYLESRSNVQITQFTVTSLDGEPIYYGVNTNELKEFLRKVEGSVRVDVTVGNEYGSRSYTHEIYAEPDYEPDLISVIWNNYLARNEALDIFNEGASLDGDTVTDSTYEIFYDADKDDIPETSVYSGVWTGSTTYTPDKLGTYKIVFTVKEEFGTETIPEHITEVDKKVRTVEREFFVENLVPMTKVYTDIEYNFPLLDVAFLIDQDYPRAENDYVRDSQVDINNEFRLKSMVANVDVWDLHTYIFSQTAYKRVHTGRSYPSSTTAYNSDGYLGTLTRYDVDNYPYTVDEGGYETFSDSKTATGTASGSGWTSYDADGNVTGSGSTNTPSIGYNSGGYSGTLYKTGGYSITSSETVTHSDGSKTVYKTYKANYSGTVTKTWQEWVSDYNTYNDFYGDYSGTVYKHVKQSYSPVYETTSNKYIVYMANNTINNTNDLTYVKDIARDAKVIFIGDPSLETQTSFAYDYFIPYTTDTAQLIDEVVSITKADNPLVNELAVLINESFNISHADIDEEGDPIVEAGYQYVHDPNYFDNPMGQEANTVTTYSDTGYGTYQATSFSKPGKYTIYRRIKDEPIGYEEQGRYSNLGTLEIAAHRMPIAKAELDWDYDPIEGVYLTTWVDKSYDPDFQYSDANRGIVDRKIKYRKSGGSWIYEIPDRLSYGTYEVVYVVKDKHGVWSNPWTMNFTLSSAPGMQLFDAKARAKEPQFSLASIPVSENLEIYDVWTRYPYDTHLEIAIYQGTTRKSPIQTVSFTEGVTGTKTDNDIRWNPISHTIPSILPDGNYIIKVKAVGVGGQTSTKDIPFVIQTPINLTGKIPLEMENVGNLAYDISATTSKYVFNVYATLFKGTSFQQTIQLKKETLNDRTQHWLEPMIPSPMMPEGDYIVELKAYTTNGKVESILLPTKIISLRVTGFVHHTELWNQHRINYNLSKTGQTNSPRTYDIFFPGEKFVLQAETIGVASYVKVDILNTPFSTVLSQKGDGKWEGSLWDKSMLYWRDQTLIFRFTAQSQGGSIKTYDVPIQIIDDSYWRQHGSF